VEGSSSFLKKRTKKLFPFGVCRRRTTGLQGENFFASFLQKRSACFWFGSAISEFLRQSLKSALID
jgi:hypothetical protein